MHTIKQFELGNTIYLEVKFRNLNSDLADPVNPQFKIYTAAGDLVIDSTIDITYGPWKRANGIWYTKWTSSIVGDYYIEWTGEEETRPVVFRKPFKVVHTTKKF